MAYKASVRLGLPQVLLGEDNRPVLQHGAPIHTGESTIKEPGDRVTIPELKAHGQTDEQIAALIAAGSLEEEEVA